jgi:hypothetical protein
MYMNRTWSRIHALSANEFAERSSQLMLFGSETPGPALTHFAVIAYPRGWFYLGQLKLNQSYDRQIAKVESIQGGAPPYTKDSEDELLQIARKKPIYRLPYLAVTGSATVVQNVIDKYLELIAKTRITETAIHISRYHQKHGAFPDRLELLVPEFLPELPKDPIDLARLRYRLSPAGYDLWSIGSNLRDDGGKSKPDRPIASQPDWVFSIPGT